MIWLAWTLLLVCQNAAHTWVSRARNTNSLGYHAVAATCSHAAWFVSQFVLVDEMVKIIRTGNWPRAVLVGVFYAACCTAGSVFMHWLSIRYLERRVHHNLPGTTA